MTIDGYPKPSWDADSDLTVHLDGCDNIAVNVTDKDGNILTPTPFEVGMSGGEATFNLQQVLCGVPGGNYKAGDTAYLKICCTSMSPEYCQSFEFPLGTDCEC